MTQFLCSKILLQYFFADSYFILKTPFLLYTMFCLESKFFVLDTLKSGVKKKGLKQLVDLQK